MKFRRTLLGLVAATAALGALPLAATAQTAYKPEYKM